MRLPPQQMYAVCFPARGHNTPFKMLTLCESMVINDIVFVTMPSELLKDIECLPP